MWLKLIYRPDRRIWSLRRSRKPLRQKTYTWKQKSNSAAKKDPKLWWTSWNDWGWHNYDGNEYQILRPWRECAKSELQTINHSERVEILEAACTEQQLEATALDMILYGTSVDLTSWKIANASKTNFSQNLRKKINFWLVNICC